MDQSHKDKIRQLLEGCGEQFDCVNVFGSVKCNIHVTCRSVETATKWSSILSEISQSKVAMAKTRWPAYDNKSVSNEPTMINGYLVAVVF